MTQYAHKKGVCFFAYNNDQLDYASMAIITCMLKIFKTSFNPQTKVLKCGLNKAKIKI